MCVARQARELTRDVSAIICVTIAAAAAVDLSASPSVHANPKEPNTLMFPKTSEAALALTSASFFCAATFAATSSLPLRLCFLISASKSSTWSWRPADPARQQMVQTRQMIIHHSTQLTRTTRAHTRSRPCITHRTPHDQLDASHTKRKSQVTYR